jgi:16S rRNA (cytosine967-C5)-methyltransferase
MARGDNQAQGVASRLAAAHALAHVFEQKHTLDDALDKAFRKYLLTEPDKRFVHAICAFVFRNLNTIDANLHRIMNRKRDASPALLHQLLRVGAAQLLYMDVSPHAAVHATVASTGGLHLSKQKGLVNAVLRSVQRERDVILDAPVLPLDQLPAWLRARWIKSYGESTARDIVTSMMREAPLDISLKNPHASDEWAQKLAGEVLCAATIRVHQSGGQIVSWPGFDAGEWWVQDIAASLPINMLADVSGKTVLDVCAAPGGKTMQLASRGAKVTALDMSAKRMQRITENLERTALAQNVSTVVSDALHWKTDERFDVVVCDAPCSSTGTLRRHPELPWIHDEKQLQKTVMMQRDLLKRASVLLRPQGQLLYCTCSMEPEEGEIQLEAFLNQNKNFKELTDISVAVQPFLKRGLNNIGWRTYPHLLAEKGGMDGFFMALLQKQ